MLGVVIAAVLGGSWAFDVLPSLATGASLVVLVPAALVDVIEHRLPNTLVGIAAVPVIIAVVASGGGLLMPALIGAAVLGGPLLVTHLVSPMGMGFGDVKAGVVAGAALGLVDPQLALWALVLALGGAACWGLARRARNVALGPALLAGAIAALALARVLGVEAL